MSDATSPRPLRADARRNYDRILAVAHEAFARDGADASLEEIARRAGVGSATLHRHFPSRRALLEVVFHDRVEALCATAHELAEDDDPGQALITWLRALGVYASSTRGLAASLLQSTRDAELRTSDSCQAMITDAGSTLLDRARGAGAVRSGVSIGDLLTLVNAISLVTERNADEAEAHRLLDIAIDGIRTT